MKCLVTGATGFIGNTLCERLLATDIQVVASSGSGGRLSSGDPARKVDLNQSAEGLQAMLSGVDAVCHLAGIAHQRAAVADYQRVNVNATLNLAQAAISSGVKRFIFVSSVKAMGVPASNRARNEAEVYPARDPYGRSKWEAEEGLRALCQCGLMDLVILRPALVYGPGAKGNLRWLIKGARVGMPRPPEAGARSLIGLEDLVALLGNLIRQAPSGQHTWNVTDDREYTARELYDVIREVMGKPHGREWLGDVGWRKACKIVDKLWRRRSGSTYEKLFSAECYSSSALKRDMGWTAKQSFRDVAPAMVEAAQS